jgi:hypothetical protein
MSGYRCMTRTEHHVSNRNKLNVLLVDDHEVVRAGYRRLLE